MSWTFSQLKAALLALTPTPADDTAAAAALNAQTVTLTPQDIPTASALSVFLLAGEWPNVVLRARGTLSGTTPPTAQDNAVKAAISALQLTQSTSAIAASDPRAWGVFYVSMEALQAVGDISQASMDTITNVLRTPTVPAWQPAVTVGDIQTARAQA